VTCGWVLYGLGNGRGRTAIGRGGGGCAEGARLLGSVLMVCASLLVRVVSDLRMISELAS